MSRSKAMSKRNGCNILIGVGIGVGAVVIVIVVLANSEDALHAPADCC